jgi:hypothetical protein
LKNIDSLIFYSLIPFDPCSLKVQFSTLPQNIRSSTPRQRYKEKIRADDNLHSGKGSIKEDADPVMSIWRWKPCPAPSENYKFEFIFLWLGKSYKTTPLVLAQMKKLTLVMRVQY